MDDLLSLFLGFLIGDEIGRVIGEIISTGESGQIRVKISGSVYTVNVLSVRSVREETGKELDGLIAVCLDDNCSVYRALSGNARETADAILRDAVENGYVNLDEYVIPVTGSADGKKEEETDKDGGEARLPLSAILIAVLLSGVSIFLMYVLHFP